MKEQRRLSADVATENSKSTYSFRSGVRSRSTYERDLANKSLKSLSELTYLVTALVQVQELIRGKN